MHDSTNSNYTAPHDAIPSHLHPNTQRKYLEILRKFRVDEQTTWSSVLDEIYAVENINTRRR